MKCLSFFLFLSLCGFLSSVASVSLSVDPADPLVGQSTIVTWTRESTDPDDLNFDLRFVQDGEKDVGLAVANIYPAHDEDSGTVSVMFPQAGTYKLVAVTGSPRFNHIGSSKVVQATPQSAPSPAPSTTSSSSPPTSMPSQSQDPPPTIGTPLSASAKNANLPMIVGGVIGGLLLLTLLAAVIIFVFRRRRNALRRISFHKDLMVQRRSPDMSQGSIVTAYPFAPSSGNPQRPAPAYRPDSTDLESGYPEPHSPTSAYPSGMSGILLPAARVSAHLGTGHIVPSPRGPRERSNSTKQDAHPPTKIVRFGVSPILPLPTLPAAPPLLTTRQRDLGDRMVQLQNQMNELQDDMRRSSPPSSVDASSASSDKVSNRNVVLGDMQKQMVWLSEVKESKWAKNETDIKPAGYSRYMTP